MSVTYCCFCQSQARFVAPDKYQLLLLRSSLNLSLVIRGLSLEDNIAFIFLNNLFVDPVQILDVFKPCSYRYRI